MAVPGKDRTKKHRDKMSKKPGWLAEQAKMKKDKFIPISCKSPKTQERIKKDQNARKRKSRQMKKERDLQAGKEKLEAAQLIVNFSNSFDKARNMTRKRVARRAADANRKIDSLKQENKDLQRKVWKYEKQKYRLEVNNSPKGTGSKNLAKEDLQSEGLDPQKHPSLVRKLTIHHALTTEIATKSKSQKTKTKRALEDLVAGANLKKERVVSAVAKSCQLNRNNLTKLNRAPKKREADKRNRLEKKILEFLHRDDVSTMLPGKRDCTRMDKNTKIQTRVMCDYMVNTYRKFRAENHHIKVGYITFSQIRPKYILLTRYTSTRSCLCYIHQNVALKLKALGLGGGLVLWTNTNAKDLGIQAKNQNDVIEYREWERVGPKGNKQYKPVMKKEGREKFLQSFEDDLKEFNLHNERAKHQYDAFRNLKDNLAENEIMVHMDFSENFVNDPQDGIQGSYWNKTALTLHPCVFYHKKDGVLHHFSAVFISDCKNHGTPAVLTIVKKINKIIDDLKFKVDVVHFVSDSPTSQYRNQTIFGMIARHNLVFGRNATWSYSEVGHGKSACDGLGGTTKRQLAEAVKQEKTIINCAQDAHDFLCSPTRQTLVAYHLYTDGDVASTAMQQKDVCTQRVPDTYKVHAVRPSTKPGYVFVRSKSCYCDRCKQGHLCPGWEEFLVVTNTPPAESMAQASVIDTSPGKYVACDYQGDFSVGLIKKNCVQKRSIVVALLKANALRPQVFRWPKASDILNIDYEDMLCNVELRTEHKGPKHQVEIMSEATLKKVRILHEQRLKAVTEQ